MTYTNAEMAKLIEILKPYLSRTDIVGYAAARNTRIFATEAKEFIDRREALIQKYGTPCLDENGNDTGMVELCIDNPNFEKFTEDIEDWATAKHEPNIYKIPAEKCIDVLSGNEILEIDWMLDFGEGGE